MYFFTWPLYLTITELYKTPAIHPPDQDSTTAQFYLTRIINFRMALTGGTYQIINSAVGLPLTPQSVASGSNIITDKNDNSDNFKVYTT